MSTTFFETKVEKKPRINPLGLKGIDLIEFIVDNADQWADFFVTKYGMSRRVFADGKFRRAGPPGPFVGPGRIHFFLAGPPGRRPRAGLLPLPPCPPRSGVGDRASPGEGA